MVESSYVTILGLGLVLGASPCLGYGPFGCRIHSARATALAPRLRHDWIQLGAWTYGGVVAGGGGGVGASCADS